MGFQSRTWLLAGWITTLMLVAQCALASHDTVAAFGDSLTEGFPFENDPWVERLAPPWEPLNLGLSGERSADGLVRLQAWLDANPGVAEIIVIMEGTNDTDEPPTWNEAQTAANLQAMVAAVEAYGAIPILMAPPPVISDAGATAKLESLASTLETWATTGQSVPFIHLFDEFDNHPSTSSLYSPDGIHFSNAGNQFVADTVRAALPAQAPALDSGGIAFTAVAIGVIGALRTRRRPGGVAARAS